MLVIWLENKRGFAYYCKRSRKSDGGTMLEAHIEMCGGISNITRLLFSNRSIILEVQEPRLLANEVVENYNDTLSQVHFVADSTLQLDQLARIGSEIRAKQLTAITPFESSRDCDFRPNWHISPPSGLLNDPNGFIYHNGEYHLFYQWSPFVCEHKDKYWAHLTSKDMVSWQTQPVALTPSDWFDSHGVFSGHAISTPEQLMLFYTGNVRIGEQRDRQTMQCLAVSKNGIDFEKLGPVISQLPEGVTPHCRDPKVIKVGAQWWMLVGVQRQDLVGRLAVYKSEDLLTWSFDKLYGDELGDFGYMWECPDLFELNGQLIALIGPQGLQADSPHHTVPHHNGYLKAAISSNGELSLEQFRTVDHGFDFYAPQTLETPDGRRILIAWMGLPDELDHPTVDNGWLHQLTSLRELTYANDHLVQVPAKEVQELRLSLVPFSLNNSYKDLKTKSFELQVELEWGSTLSLFKDSDYECRIILDEQTNTLTLDRSRTLIREGDTIRQLALNGDKVKLHILADSSSIEIFINDGDYVMSSRVFTPAAATLLALSGHATFQFWPLTSSNKSCGNLFDENEIKYNNMVGASNE